MLNLLAVTTYDWYVTLSAICVILSVIAAIFVIIVVIMQPSNSNGVGAISGHSETFYGKNKSKTLESKMKKLTIIAIAVLAVCMIVFFLLQYLFF
ncbi:MAG: preprotein translocase subunit SecG [Clostridia bacterium]|nr:preprotein translocase subunit SecG [Clostridia bacterium]